MANGNSDSNKSTISANPNMIASLVVILVIFGLSASVAITIAVPDGAVAGSMITILLAALAPTVASIVNLARTNAINDKTDKVLNSTMQNKIRETMLIALQEHTNKMEAAKAQEASITTVLDHKIQDNVKDALLEHDQRKATDNNG